MRPDPLSDVLASIRLTGSVVFSVEGAAPWAVEAPPASAFAGLVLPGVDHVVEFHAVTRGRCLGGIRGEAPVALEAGDVICFPHGDPHVMASGPGLQPQPFGPFDLAPPAGARPPFPMRLGEGPAEVHLVCGFFGCDVRPFNPLLSALPRMLRASDREGARGGSLSMFMEVAEAEAAALRPGRDGVLARLSELLFVEIVRRHLEALPPDRAGWLAGLRDPHVGRALAALHAEPGQPWTIEALGREAGLSRSALAERFAALVGEPPIQYLGRWRMQVAAGLLASGHAGIAEVGARVGYASEAAFSRAFKKLVGVPPATWRRRRAGGSEAGSSYGPATTQASGSAPVAG